MALTAPHAWACADVVLEVPGPRASVSAMCFDPLATPPPLPSLMPTNEVTSSELVLDSGDTQFRAHLSLAPSWSRTAVVVLPDVRGLFGYYEQLTTRFAAAGHHAIAFDYFGRTAGLSPRPNEFEFMPHIKATTPEQVRADAAACVSALRERADIDHVVTVGFCFGGSQSYLATTDTSLGLSGAIALSAASIRAGWACSPRP